MTTPLKLVIDAVASTTDQAGLGFWNPHGTYPNNPNVPPIYAKRFPPKAPDNALTINAYGIQVSPDPNQPVETIRVQVRSRAKNTASLVVDDIADPILTLLHGAHHQKWGALTIQRCQHLSTAQLGVDAAGLDERTDNYQLEII